MAESLGLSMIFTWLVWPYDVFEFRVGSNIVMQIADIQQHTIDAEDVIDTAIRGFGRELI